ncbi:MAG: hypothetical protein JNM22_13660 [Saprospiraceae bacterium]|nr:hypothetical protein [Saprospiraceae bacterium]
MNIYLASDTSMGTLQAQFNSFFPNLKLAFFSKPHDDFKSSAAKFLIQEKNKPLGELTDRLLMPDKVEVHADMKVLEVENLFEEKFGLHVQVFRRSGKIWLETSKTDHLTLAEQELKALDSDHIHTEFGDPMDYREQD